MWFNLYTRQNVVKSMFSTAKEVQSYKFLPLVYQIASRLGISREGQNCFQTPIHYLVKKMAIDHPYHTIFQIFALANGDRIKDKQRNKNSFVDLDKKLTAENLLEELSSSHGLIIPQMKQMVEIYIKLAELETKMEDTNKKVPLSREVRCIRLLELVFRIVSLWFNLYTRQNVVKSMFTKAKEVQSYKFLSLVYQIASRLGISKEGQNCFQTAIHCLVKKMAIDHPYHTIFQILALANGDWIKDKQRNKNSFVDLDKKLAGENLLEELSSSHGLIIPEMKQMVEIYIKLAELESKMEDTNKKVPLPREVRCIRLLELLFFCMLPRLSSWFLCWFSTFLLVLAIPMC